MIADNVEWSHALCQYHSYTANGGAGRRLVLQQTVNSAGTRGESNFVGLLTPKNPSSVPALRASHHTSTTTPGLALIRCRRCMCMRTHVVFTS